MHALFGGTFDPIHQGHLKLGRALAELVGLKRITLLPNRQPHYRSPPLATIEQRLTMIQLAIQGEPLFTIDDRELRRPTPSYTLESLQAVRTELGSQQSLSFILGQDAFLTLHHWYHWQQLLHYSHLLVSSRPGYPSNNWPRPLQSCLAARQVTEPRKLHQAPQGYLYLASLPPIPISATLIRQRLQRDESCCQLLPASVLTYIQQQGLYC
jgi:nicotinate-nucleotide adenylyltransferase